MNPETLTKALFILSVVLGVLGSSKYKDILKIDGEYKFTDYPSWKLAGKTDPEYALRPIFSKVRSHSFISGCMTGVLISAFISFLLWK